MTKTEITTAIVDYLKDNVKDILIEPSYLARSATKGYYNFSANGCILVWYVGSPQFVDLNYRDEQSATMQTSYYLERMQFVISVGLRTLKQPFELDELVESVMGYLINYDLVGIDPFVPVNISENTVDANEVHWRQIVIETRQDVRIAKH